MTYAPKTIVGSFLGLLLVGAIATLFLDAEHAVPIARGICILLAIALLVGVIGPARRHLARRQSPPPNDRDPESSDPG